MNYRLFIAFAVSYTLIVVGANYIIDAYEDLIPGENLRLLIASLTFFLWMGIVIVFGKFIYDKIN